MLPPGGCRFVLLCFCFLFFFSNSGFRGLFPLFVSFPEYGSLPRQKGLHFLINLKYLSPHAICVHPAKWHFILYCEQKGSSLFVKRRREWVKDLNRHFCKEDMPTASWYMKTVYNVNRHQEMLVRTTIRCYLIRWLWSPNQKVKVSVKRKNGALVWVEGNGRLCDHYRTFEMLSPHYLTI